uniref:Ribose transport system permease protein n=1 Tax=Candidatus Kentrum sp. LPFa TaxID=2126335 RepID=A0A450VSW6_9GAMM|nr:MAG: ribose transport system permease protein [Candidatus Kentron sp. LPFa]
MLTTRLSLIAAIICIGIVTFLIEPAFASTRNLANILTQSAPIGVVAIGMTFVIIAGAIDLSVGSVAALAGIVFANVLLASDSYLSAIFFTVGCCLLLGLVNGVLSTRLNLAPFLATLGMMGVARGLAFVVSGGEPISGIAAELRILFQPWLGLVTPAAVVLILLAFFCQVFLSSTVWGTRLIAIGSNEVAARLSGLKVVRYKITSFVIAGLAAGLGGLLLVSRLGSAQPLAGNLYELDAIAAAVIGGGSLNGGRGDMLGTLLGVILIVELRNAVTILGLPTHAQPIFIGILLIVAVSIDFNRKKLIR